MNDLAAAQSELVAALTGTGPVPAGFDTYRVEAARKVLLRKRIGEVADRWPALQASMADRFAGEFADWAAARPTRGSWRDGWDFAAHVAQLSELPEAAARELAERRLMWTYDGISVPRRRRFPAMGFAGGRLMLQVGGRVRSFGR